MMTANRTAQAGESRLAIKIADSMAQWLMISDKPKGTLEQAVDLELQEVREVLTEVIREHDDPMSDYGCTTHTTERARALWSKLEVKGG